MDEVQHPNLEESIYAVLAGTRQIDNDIRHLKDRLA